MTEGTCVNGYAEHMCARYCDQHTLHNTEYIQEPARLPDIWLVVMLRHRWVVWVVHLECA